MNINVALDNDGNCYFPEREKKAWISLLRKIRTPNNDFVIYCNDVVRLPSPCSLRTIVKIFAEKMVPNDKVYLLERAKCAEDHLQNFIQETCEILKQVDRSWLCHKRNMANSFDGIISQRNVTARPTVTTLTARPTALPGQMFYWASLVAVVVVCVAVVSCCVTLVPCAIYKIRRRSQRVNMKPVSAEDETSSTMEHVQDGSSSIVEVE